VAAKKLFRHFFSLPASASPSARQPVHLDACERHDLAVAAGLEHFDGITA